MTVEEEIEKSIKLIEGDYKEVKEFAGVLQYILLIQKMHVMSFIVIKILLKENLF